MYDRAPRNIGQLAGATPLHVGPGTYDVSKSKKEEIGIKIKLGAQFKKQNKKN
jgi:hypothetical protein